ncbi:helix-turn-helix domain-containing protein [Lysinibacillus sphaericus]|uniref:Ferrichrome ABC transporter substrate-binding protein FhuD n=1 Tax=Lysinibacillus sphaericus OT4b.31 TaxID=1285586 RepID=R7ZA77_LYSSH|nr:AraC family transcriptional regulator [Lysinibacillus sphaericus]EON70881.1 ferrichrome ABC transporter substrate-binding protein FhuD [Lysinibacillus sphaericus OT4b.31]
MDNEVIHNYIVLWDHATIKVLDVRYFIMDDGEKLPTYRLPTSAFLFAMNGSANITLDGNVQIVKPFHVMHGGKGMHIEITANNHFEYYIIFYKARLPLYSSKKLMQLLEYNSPFQIHYGFTPKYPLTLFENVNLMYTEWQKGGVLERLHVKSIFYRFVYELQHQVYEQNNKIEKSDLSSQVMGYVQQKYNQPITLESLSQDLNYSAQYLSRTFKHQTGQSPIAYLIKVRMEKAQKLLLYTNATVQEIAEHVGYSDQFYFNRTFKKYTSVTPGNFKKHTLEKQKVLDSPYHRYGFSIVNKNSNHYSLIDGDNHYQYGGEEDLLMFKGRKASLLATLLLCFTLLFSGCSNEGSTNTGAVIQGQSETTNIETYTYKGANGEVEIPKNPQRIIVVANNHVGYLLALGITPVGMSDRALSNPFFEGKIDGVESYGDSSSLEKIVDLKPDLIFTLDNMENLDNIEKIAPTIAIKYGDKDYREQLLEYGEILGKEKKAQEWIANWDEKIAKYKPSIQGIVSDQKVSILGGTAKSIGAFGDFYGRGGEIIYKEFNLKAPDIIQQGAIDSKEGYYSLSLEKLPEYAGDYLFISENLEQEIKENVLYQSLLVVKNNRVFPIDEDAYYFNDPISLEQQLEEVVNLFKSTQ